jgi:hypothetical protein
MPRSLWQGKCGFSSTPITEDEGDQTRSIGQSEPTEITTNITLEDAQTSPLKTSYLPSLFKMIHPHLSNPT